MNWPTFESALLCSRTVNNRSTNHSEGTKRVYLLKPSARVIWRFESGAWANMGHAERSNAWVLCSQCSSMRTTVREAPRE